MNVCQEVVTGYGLLDEHCVKSRLFSQFCGPQLRLSSFRLNKLRLYDISEGRNSQSFYFCVLIVEMEP